MKKSNQSTHTIIRSRALTYIVTKWHYFFRAQIQLYLNYLQRVRYLDYPTRAANDQVNRQIHVCTPEGPRPTPVSLSQLPAGQSIDHSASAANSVT